jgi:hypothetical protein
VADSPTSIVAIITIAQLLITVLQTIGMEYLRRRFPTASMVPPPMSSKEIEEIRSARIRAAAVTRAGRRLILDPPRPKPQNPKTGA